MSLGTGPVAAASAGPLRAVLTAVESGAPTMDAVARTTGLSRDLVETAVEHLVRLGRLTSQALTMACPASGCGGCPVAVDMSACTAAPGGRPVLLALTPSRPGEQRAARAVRRRAAQRREP